MMNRRIKSPMGLDSKSPLPGLFTYVRRSQTDRQADKEVRTLCDDEGATLVETAVSFSVFFGIVFGIIIMSWALYAYVFISEASREATRWAIVRGSSCINFTHCNASNTDIQTYVRSVAFPGINPTKITTTTEWYTVRLGSSPSPTTITDCGGTPTVGTVICNQPGNEVQVGVTYTLPLDIPFWKNTSLTVGSRSEMVISQ